MSLNWEPDSHEVGPAFQSCHNQLVPAEPQLAAASRHDLPILAKTSDNHMTWPSLQYSKSPSAFEQLPDAASERLKEDFSFKANLQQPGGVAVEDGMRSQIHDCAAVDHFEKRAANGKPRLG